MACLCLVNPCVCGALPEDLHLRFDKADDLTACEKGGAEARVVAYGLVSDVGVTGGGARFDGTASIEISSGFATGSTFTLECWLKPDALSRDDGPINIITRREQFLLRLNPQEKGRQLSFFVYIDGRWEPRVQGDQLQADRWHHVVVMWWGRGLVMWVDGVVFSTPRDGRLPPGEGPIQIGESNEYGAGFAGVMDNFSLYPKAHSRDWAMRRIWLGDNPVGEAEVRVLHGIGITVTGDAVLQSSENDRIDVHLPNPTSAIIARGGLTAPLPAGIAGWLLSMSATGARRLEMITFTPEHHARSQIIVIPDDREREVFAPIDSVVLSEPAEAVVMRFCDAGEGTRLRLGGIRPASAPPSIPCLDIRTFSPHCRYCALGDTVQLYAEIANRGDGEGQMVLSLQCPESIHLLDGKPVQEVDIPSHESVFVTWSVVADVVGVHKLIVEGLLVGDVAQSAVTTLAVADNPAQTARLAGEKASTAASLYPRVMDFRHLGSDRLETYAGQSMILVDLIGDKIENARAFKKRYPDVVVLMQVNDEPNGLWGSWFTVPREFALKEGLRCRPDVFPMPSYKGFWLLRPGVMVRVPIGADKEEFEIQVSDPARFVQRAFGGRGEGSQDCLIYRKTADGPDYNNAEYLSVVSVDQEARTVRFRRWPKSVVGVRHAFEAGKAYVAPSAGDMYSQKGVGICTWVPNLTKFCPKDPETGMDAAEWWAAHFAHLWHDIIARDEPHPDGYQFDWAPFRAHKKDADADNDGEPDGGEIGGISYWGLGMHRFFYLLRSGGTSWQGVGWDTLLLADSSSPGSQRSFSVLNGAENEEFCGFDRRRNFSAQFDLYRVWARYSRSPHLTYLQSRFPSEIWYEGSLSQEIQKTRFRMSNHIRLAAAAACMELGIHTYRPGGRADINSINQAHGGERYDIDEYNAGAEHRFGWLGHPLEEAHYLETNQVDPLIIPWSGWEASGHSDRVSWRQPAVLPDGAVLHLHVEQISAVRPDREAASCWSPAFPFARNGGSDLTLLFEIRADPVYDDMEGDLYSGIMRSVSFVAESGGIYGNAQEILAGDQWRSVRLVLPVGDQRPIRLGVLYGAELGSVWLRELCVLPGQHVAMVRRFSGGIVLMNPDPSSPLTVNLAEEAGEKRELRRLHGIHEPWPNTGEAVGGKVQIPAEDALFLTVTRSGLSRPEPKTR